MADTADDEKLRAAIIAEVEKMKKRAEKVGAQIKALKAKPPVFYFKGLVKVYMDAVKKSDGLTTARPATLKAVQTAEKNATADTVKQAVKGLDDHKKDVQKQFGKEKDKKKQIDAFEKGVDNIIAELEKQLK